MKDYWDNQWKVVAENKEFEEYSQSIPNDFLQAITKPREVLTVIKESKTILDFGFGTGHLCHVMSLLNWSVIEGVEISSYAVDYANKKYGNGRVSYSVNKLEKNYDLIVVSNVLEHYKNPFPQIEELRLHCKNLIILVPYKGTDTCGYTEDGGDGHVFSFNAGCFDNYDVIEMFTFFSRGWTEGDNPLQLCVLIKGK